MVGLIPVAAFKPSWHLWLPVCVHRPRAPWPGRLKVECLHWPISMYWDQVKHVKLLFSSSCCWMCQVLQFSLSFRSLALLSCTCIEIGEVPHSCECMWERACIHRLSLIVTKYIFWKLSLKLSRHEELLPGGHSCGRDNMWLNDVCDWQGQSWMRRETLGWGVEGRWAESTLQRDEEAGRDALLSETRGR